VNKNPFARTACAYGPMAFGAWSVWSVSMDMP